MTKIVALHGLHGSGKDTAANHLRRAHNFASFSFGEALYREVATMFETRPANLKNRETKENPQNWLALIHCQHSDYRQYMHRRGEDMFTPRTSRYHMQNYGDDFTIQNDSAKWVNIAIEKMRKAENWIDLVIPDLYQKKELNALRVFATQTARNLVVVEIVREGTAAYPHVSNVRLPDSDIDVTVHNHEGQAQDFLQSLDEVLDSKSLFASL